MIQVRFCVVRVHDPPDPCERLWRRIQRNCTNDWQVTSVKKNKREREKKKKKKKEKSFMNNSSTNKQYSDNIKEENSLFQYSIAYTMRQSDYHDQISWLLWYIFAYYSAVKLYQQFQSMTSNKWYTWNNLKLISWLCTTSPFYLLINSITQSWHG